MPSFVFIYKSSGKSLSLTEKTLIDIVNSPLSVEILYDAICQIRLKANLSDYEVRQILAQCYNDWDK